MSQRDETGDQAERGPQGRFAPGVSGNPAGRPPKHTLRFELPPHDASTADIALWAVEHIASGDLGAREAERVAALLTKVSAEKQALDDDMPRVALLAALCKLIPREVPTIAAEIVVADCRISFRHPIDEANLSVFGIIVRRLAAHALHPSALLELLDTPTIDALRYDWPLMARPDQLPPGDFPLPKEALEVP